MIVNATLNDAGNWASIIAAVASVTILVVGGVRCGRQWWRLRHPLDVQYGGSGKVALIGRGSNELSFTIRARTDLVLEKVDMTLRGPVENHPRHTLDQWAVREGEVHLPRGEALYRTYACETRGPWSGEMDFRFVLRTPDAQASKFVTRRVPIQVRAATR